MPPSGSEGQVSVQPMLQQQQAAASQADLTNAMLQQPAPVLESGDTGTVSLQQAPGTQGGHTSAMSHSGLQLPWATKPNSQRSLASTAACMKWPPGAAASGR